MRGGTAAKKKKKGKTGGADAGEAKKGIGLVAKGQD